MVFVRWHYRDGVYVRSHYRRRHPPPTGQAVLVGWPPLRQPPAPRSGPGSPPVAHTASRVR